ncbi:26581_t:CDS:2, partial [Racocetra persica]
SDASHKDNVRTQVVNNKLDESLVKARAKEIVRSTARILNNVCINGGTFDVKFTQENQPGKEVIEKVYVQGMSRLMDYHLAVQKITPSAKTFNSTNEQMTASPHIIVSTTPLTPNSPYTQTPIVSVVNENNVSQSPDDDILDFSNHILLIIISVIISIVILGLDLFLVFSTIKDAITR